MVLMKMEVEVEEVVVVVLHVHSLSQNEFLIDRVKNKADFGRNVRSDNHAT